MFKSMLKRSWLSTVRKPSRTIIVALILFAMANLMLATIAIRNSVSVSVDAAKEKLGGIVYLTVDSEKLQQQIQELRSSAGTQSTTETGTNSFKMPTISESLAKQIGESEYLSNATYSIGVTANAANYTAVQTTQNQREREMQEQFKNAQNQVNDMQNEYNAARNNYNNSQSTGDGGGRMMINGGGKRFEFDMNLNITDPTLSGGDTTLSGIDDFNFVSEVEAGTISLVDGETYAATDENVAIVSQQLLDDNSLKIGDTISLTTVDGATEISLKIVGAYQSTSVDESGQDTFNNNTIYVSVATVKKFMTAEQLEKLTVNNVKYYLAKAEQKDAFLASANEKFGAQLDGLKLDIDDSSYQTMVGPIENVGSFASVVMWIVIAASVVIITLIVVINVKDRRYEMGVLLSLGARRASILGQVFLELVIVGTVAFALSLATSQLIASKMGESLLAQQVASASESAEKSASENANTMNGGRALRFGQQTASKAKAIDEINVSAGMAEYLTLFGAGYAILIVAMILPSINILRYQPKTILSGKE